MQLQLLASLFLALHAAGRRARADPQVHEEGDRGGGGGGHATSALVPRGTHGTAPLRGPHVCGQKCCVGWSWSQKTRSCTKPRCLPRCHNGAVCRPQNLCLCRNGFHGDRCQFSAVTVLLLESDRTRTRTSTMTSSSSAAAGQKSRGVRKVQVVIVSGNSSSSSSSTTTPAVNSGINETTSGFSLREEVSSEKQDRGSTERGPSAENEVSIVSEEERAAKRTDENLKTNLQDELHLKTSPETEVHDGSLDRGTTEAEVHDGSLDRGTTEAEVHDGSLDRGMTEAEVHDGSLDRGMTEAEVHDGSLDRGTTEAEVHDGSLDRGTTEAEVHDGSLDRGTTEAEVHDGSLDRGMTEAEVHDGSLDRGTTEAEVHDGSLDRGTTEAEVHDGSLDRGTTEAEVHDGSLDRGMTEAEVHDGSLDRGMTEAEVHDGSLDRGTTEAEVHDGSLDRGTTEAEVHDGSLDRGTTEAEVHDGSLDRGTTEAEVHDGSLDRGTTEAEVHDGSLEETVRSQEKRKPSLSVREVQSLLLRKAMGRRGDKMAALLMRHIEKERSRLQSVSTATSINNNITTATTPAPFSEKVFHTERGQYTVLVSTAGQKEDGGGDRIQVMFTPTVCKVRCVQDRCVNFCERGDVRTVYSSDGQRGTEEGNSQGFRVFLCPLLCKNGGLCLQKDRCLCPPNFTGKFCQIPVSLNASSVNHTEASPSTTNEIARPTLFSTNQELTRSEFLLPLGPNPETQSAGAPSPRLVKVRVQHPPEASVKVHQVLKVPGASVRSAGATTSGSAGFPAPLSRDIQAQTFRGTGTYTQYSGFKYCFREVKDGQCSSPLPGLRSRDTCCRGIGKAWGIIDCELCPHHAGRGNSSCPVGFELNGTKCEDINECLQPGLCENGLCVNTRGSYSCVCSAGFILDATHGICISQSVISEEKGQCFRVLGPASAPSSCSLPIHRSITKQICCCSRVGKAWGPDCQRCPYFGSVAFKEICPAGPGYHYSASALQFTQRAMEHLGHRGALLLPTNTTTTDNNNNLDTPGSGPGSGVAQSRPSPQVPKKPSPPESGSRPVPPPSGSSRFTSPQAAQRHSDGSSSSLSSSSSSSSFKPVQSSVSSSSRDKPQTSGRSEPGGGLSPSRPEQTVNALPRPQSPAFSLPRPRVPVTTTTKRPVTTTTRRPVTTTTRRPVASKTTKRPTTTTSTRPPRVHSAAGRGVCETRPGVCGRGLCVNQPGGRHTCVCYHGYQPNAHNTTCQDVDECRHSPCGTHARCENSPGSYRCVCHRGYKLRGNTCTDLDECEDVLLCPGQECVNSQGSYRCVSCPPGFGLLNRVCTDVDECRQAPCTNGHCENTPGSYRCICHHGYRLNNNTCTDVDECLDPSQCPGQMCVNTVGSYRCVSCRPGYRLHSRQCIDINECEERQPCPGQKCVNSEGSYSCVSCSEGYSSVSGLCTDIDECSNPSQCPGQMCVNTVGSYRCVSCRPGHSLRDGSCQDLDECESPRACASDRVCVNTVGSFRCDCPPGYGTSGLGRTCRDINECLQSGLCLGGDCVNTPGSFTCVCSQGFTLSTNNTSCTDVNECERPGLCADGRCVNSEGSYHCVCNNGFIPNPERTACLDVDECVSSGGSVCGTRRCENTIGSFHCLTSCEPGFQVSASGSCVDVNECRNRSVCGDHAVCQNLVGTYQCLCDQGFSSTPDGKSCIDEDECVSLSGVCGSALCVNVPGSFMCECERDGEEFNPSLKRCTSNAPEAPSSPSSSGSSSSSSSSPLPPAGPGELRECYYNLSERGTCSLLSPNTTLQECCCTAGQGWGLGCVYHTCPHPRTEEFQSLCPNGRGYVTTGPGAFDYRDVDECKRFGPELCKNGVCVNNIPGYSCYCSSGYVYNSTQLECIDHDECEEESCVGGLCVNTVGSYYCSCPHPLVLDDTQRNCVNASHLTQDENLSLCWQQVNADLLCQSLLHGTQLSFTDCCCLYGEGWGLQCALCPAPDSEDYASLCSPVHSVYTDSFPDSGTPTGARPGASRGGAAAPYFPPFTSELYPSLDYDDSSPVGGSRGRFDDSSPVGGSRGRFDPAFGGRSPAYGSGYFPESDYGPDTARPFSPADGSRFSPDSRPFLVPPDPRSEQAFEVQPPPASRPSFYREEDEEEDEWRGFPPFTRPGPRRVYDRRFEELAAAEDCGILHGCENGRCIRVSEGYTCDCYHGYELDLTAMSCVDVNECEAGVRLEFPCVNARCVNTEGSYRCVCRRGYILSHRPNHCVAA